MLCCLLRPAVSCCWCSCWLQRKPDAAAALSYAFLTPALCHPCVPAGGGGLCSLPPQAVPRVRPQPDAPGQEAPPLPLLPPPGGRISTCVCHRHADWQRRQRRRQQQQPLRLPQTRRRRRCPLPAVGCALMLPAAQLCIACRACPSGCPFSPPLPAVDRALSACRPRQLCPDCALPGVVPSSHPCSVYVPICSVLVLSCETLYSPFLLAPWSSVWLAALPTCPPSLNQLMQALRPCAFPHTQAMPTLPRHASLICSALHFPMAGCLPASCLRHLGPRCKNPPAPGIDFVQFYGKKYNY